MSGPVLECQQCGTVVRQLSPWEAQQVSQRPYAFIVFCRECRSDNEETA